MHVNAIKESQRLGGLYTYTCSLGFALWISPVYFNEHFIGALLGGNFTGEEQDKSRALAEIMLICAQFLSVGSEECHKNMELRSTLQSELLAKIEELKKQFPQENVRLEYPSDKEQKMLDALRQGDTNLTKRLLNEILAFIFYSNPNEFSHSKCRVIELAFLLSRVGLRSLFTVKTMLKNDRRNLLLIEKAQTMEELAGVLYQITDDLEEQIKSFQKMHHAAAFKKAEDYILENFAKKLTLKGISQASGFSAPYFSKIFKEEMGETLTTYLNRLRVEKAASLLTNTNLSLCDIAQDCGFADQSWFSKTFKLYIGRSPGKYRSQFGKPL